MFFFSMLEDGPRGVSGGQRIRDGDGDQEVEDEESEDEDLATYGIDWDAMEDEQLMEHHYENNPPQLRNPFETAPPTLSEVTCTPPSCPLSEEAVRQLDFHLSQSVDLTSHSILLRRTVWVEALRICTHLW